MLQPADEGEKDEEGQQHEKVGSRVVVEALANYFGEKLRKKKKVLKRILKL